MKPALTLLILIFSLATPAQAKRVPNLGFKDMAGDTHRLGDLRGSIVVLNFWATWCGPCRQELPLLTRLDHDYAPKGVRFIAASADQLRGQPKIKKFLDPQNIALTVWLGADLDMLERVELGNLLPATLILDEQGEVVARVMGQAREEDIKVPLDWLLGGKPGQPPPAVVKRY